MLLLRLLEQALCLFGHPYRCLCYGITVWWDEPNNQTYRPPESDLLEDYITHAADSLTIDPTFRLQKHVAKLETERTEEIDRLKAKLAKLRVENQESTTTMNTKLYERNNDIAELKAAVAFLADKVNAAIIANESSSKVIFNQKGVATGIKIPAQCKNTATCKIAKTS